MSQNWTDFVCFHRVVFQRNYFIWLWNVKLDTQSHFTEVSKRCRRSLENDRLHLFDISPYTVRYSIIVFIQMKTTLFCKANKSHMREFFRILFGTFWLVCSTYGLEFFTHAQNYVIGGPSRYLDHVHKVNKNFCRGLSVKNRKFHLKNEIFSE